MRTVIAGIQAPLSCSGDVIWSQTLQRRRGNLLQNLSVNHDVSPCFQSTKGLKPHLINDILKINRIFK